MEEIRGENQNQYSSNSSSKSMKDNEEVIENYSYEEFNNNDNELNEEQKSSEISHKSNEENDKLSEEEVNKLEISPNLQSKREEPKKENEPEGNEEIKEQEEIVLEKNTSHEQLITKIDKTIFSKLSEEMYNNIVRQWNCKNNFNYDEFINERFLETYSDKINGDNNKKIKEFMERNESYNNHKYYTVDTIQNRAEQINSIKNEKEKKQIKMSKVQCDMFIEKQFNYIQAKKDALQQMREEQEKIQKKELKEVPTINKGSKLYPYKTKPKLAVLTQNKKKCNNKIDKAKKPQGETKQIGQKNKLTNEEIKKLVDKLYQKNSILLKETNCMRKCKSSSCHFASNANQCLTTMNNAKQKSTSLLIESYMNEIKREVFNIKNESIERNIVINNTEYNQLLSQMGYVSLMKTTDASILKLNSLAKQLWDNTLIKVKENITDKIELNTLIILLLSLEGFIKEESILKQNYSWLDINNHNYDHIKSKEIRSKYYQLVLNRKQIISIKKKERHLSKNSYSTSELFSPSSFKPKLNSMSSTKYFHKEYPLKTTYHPVHRLKLSQSYNIIPTRHYAKMLQLKDEFEKQALAECTFYPNNIIPVNRSISNKVSNRLYSSASRQLLRNKIKSMNKQPTIDETSHYTIKKAALNQQMFHFNPVSDDYLFARCIERYAKTRLEKQLKNYMKGKGVYSIEQLRQLVAEDLHKEENTIGKGFRFDNEIKTNKESFDKYSKQKQNNIYSKNSQRNKKALLLSFEIKIQNKKTILNYYHNDDPEKIVDDFVHKYHLSLQSKTQILKVLFDRLYKSADDDN